MKFSDFVCFDAIVSKVRSSDRNGVITELVEALAKAGELDAADCKKIAKAVIKREDEASTGKQKVSSAKDIVDILKPQLRDLKTEVFKVVYLDSNNRIIDIADTATGTVNHATPIVREIIHSALQKFAVSIVCVHNHPSANITPSTQDKKFTKELSDAGKLMEIKLVDHIIIGDDSYYSFSDEGML